MISLPTTTVLRLPLSSSGCYQTNLVSFAGGANKNDIAIANEAIYPFGGNVYYVTMQITFPFPEFARKERNLHCDVVHVVHQMGL